jgi:hypothetical protein
VCPTAIAITSPLSPGSFFYDSVPLTAPEAPFINSAWHVSAHMIPVFQPPAVEAELGLASKKDIAIKYEE